MASAAVRGGNTPQPGSPWLKRVGVGVAFLAAVSLAGGAAAYLYRRRSLAGRVKPVARPKPVPQPEVSRPGVGHRRRG